MLTFLGEFIGTALLVFLGNGCVANVLLKKSKGTQSGWIVITTGWALAVALAVYVSGWESGGHINPAVSISLAVKGSLPWSILPNYLAGQFLGAFFGSFLVWVVYMPHWRITPSAETRLSCFATMPATQNRLWSFICEFLATAVLMFGVERIVQEYGGMQHAEAPLLVGATVFVIGLCLGGPTGFAINPARDFSPRLLFSLLPIGSKRSAGWSYAFVPVVAPILGAIFGVWLYGIIAPLFL